MLLFSEKLNTLLFSDAVLMENPNTKLNKSNFKIKLLLFKKTDKLFNFLRSLSLSFEF